MKNLSTLAITIVTATLVGCGGGGGDSTPAPTKVEQYVTGLPTGDVTKLSKATLQSTTSAGLALTYTSNTPAVCTITGTTLNFVSEGSCTVKYAQSGNANYLPLSGSFTVVVKPSKNYYDLKPDIKSCKSGVISEETRQAVIAEVNKIRKLHGVPSLTYNKELEPLMAETALAMAGQGTTSHYVDSTWNCYSEMAVTGAKQSSLYSQVSTNLATQSDPIAGLDGLMRENYSHDLGHRRWLLSPFVKQTSFGMADGEKKVGTGYTFGASLFMYDPKTYGSSSTDAPLGIYPYPVGDYPSRLYQKGDRMSLFILADKTSYTKNRNVDYKNATVSITDESGKKYEVAEQLFDNSGQGVPNNLSFLFPDFQYNTSYKVNVSNVMVNGVAQNYEYSFSVKQ